MRISDARETTGDAKIQVLATTMGIEERSNKEGKKYEIKTGYKGAFLVENVDRDGNPVINAYNTEKDIEI